MSLIADALKAAQRERDKQKGGDAADARRARAVLRGQQATRGAAAQGGARVTAPISRPEGWSGPVVAAAAVFVATLIVATAVIVLSRSDDREPVDFASGPVPSDASTPPPVEIDLSQAPPLPGAVPLSMSEPDLGPAPTQRIPAGAGEGPGDAPAQVVSDSTLGDLALDPAAVEREAPVIEARGRSTRPFRVTVSGPGGAGGSALERSAAEAERRGDAHLAAQLYQRAIDASPRDARLHARLGAALLAAGDPRGARTALTRSLELDPEAGAAWNTLGLVQQTLGDATQARVAFERAITLDPHDTGARVNLAIQYQALGLLDQAEALLGQAIATDPTLPQAQYEMARLLEQRGDVAGAIRHYTLFLNTADGRFGELEQRVRSRITLLGAR